MNKAWKIYLLATTMVIGWLYLVHEGLHAMACSIVGQTPYYHFSILHPMVSCNVSPASSAFLFVALMPYLVDMLLLIVLFKRQDTMANAVKLTVIFDLIGNLTGLFLNNAGNDFTLISQHISGFWLVVLVGLVIGLTGCVTISFIKGGLFIKERRKLYILKPLYSFIINKSGGMKR